MRLAEQAFENELKNPSITTIQSMLLLSVLNCIQSIDAKGWMLSGMSVSSMPFSLANTCLGNACRLVFDLGLHQDASYISETTLSAIDIEARQMAFWGCFNLDRYLK
jgi:hypothetical protein